MRDLSNADIKDGLKKLFYWKDEKHNGLDGKFHCLHDLEIKITRFANEERIDVMITSMYEHPPKSKVYLEALSTFFDTDGIDVYDDISNEGCETCDYGSSYGFMVRVWPYKNEGSRITMSHPALGGSSSDV